MRLIGLVLCVLLASCSKLNREKHNVSTEAAAAQEELTRTLGSPVGISVKDDLRGDVPEVSVEVRLSSKPDGLTPEEVKRTATLIVRKHIVHVKDVVVLSRE